MKQTGYVANLAPLVLTSQVSSIQHSAETLPDMIVRYRDLENKINLLTRRIEQEKGTLKTILHIRGKAGAMFGVIHARDKDKARGFNHNRSLLVDG